MTADVSVCHAMKGLSCGHHRLSAQFFFVCPMCVADLSHNVHVLEVAEGGEAVEGSDFQAEDVDTLLAWEGVSPLLQFLDGNPAPEESLIGTMAC